MVGINIPTDILKLAVSRLERGALTWWRQLAHRGADYELGTLIWLNFKSDLMNTFVDVDCDLKLCRQLAAVE